MGDISSQSTVDRAPQRVVVIDTETTGLSATSRVVELAAVEVDPRTGRVGRRLHELVDPCAPIPAAVTHIHGIAQRDVAGKPRFEDVADPLSAFLTGATLVAQNAPFDCRVLDAELTRAGRRPLRDLGVRVVDTVAVSRALFPLEPSHNLDSICDRTGIDRTCRTRHGALLDAQLLARSLPRLAAGYDAWCACVDSPNVAALGPFVRELQRLCVEVEAESATQVAERADDAFLRVVTTASWLRTQERDFMERVEDAVGDAGWCAKRFAARWSSTRCTSWKEATSAYLADADLAAFQSESRMQVLTSRLGVASAAEIPVSSSLASYNSELRASWPGAIHAAFALGQACERVARARDALREMLLRCHADGYTLRNAKLHDVVSRHTNYRAAITALAADADVSAFTTEHRSLRLRARDMAACATLFGNAGSGTLFDFAARVA